MELQRQFGHGDLRYRRGGKMYSPEASISEQNVCADLNGYQSSSQVLQRK
jgi:hypothetical protein